MSNKKCIFAADYDDEPTALAYTDFSKPMPILEGEVAERFIRKMEENEIKADEQAKKPMSVEEAKQQLSYEKMFLSLKEDELKEIKSRIEKLEYIINQNN
jgi:hypothetical protein